VFSQTTFFMHALKLYKILGEILSMSFLEASLAMKCPVS